MKKILQYKWYLLLSAALIVSSMTVYFAQILIFKKTEDTFFYLFQDLAFVPVQVLLVMVIIDRLLRKKEKEALMNKLNMIIGVFFNEVGTELITYFARLEDRSEDLRGHLLVDAGWKKADFGKVRKFLRSYTHNIIIDTEVVTEMKDFLLSKKDEMMRMLENPNLLEHDEFTDLLWAVFHLTDELYFREDLSILPEPDLDHLKGDMSRACSVVMRQWLEYMEHLKVSYPYLFSLAVRTNPFKKEKIVYIEK